MRHLLLDVNIVVDICAHRAPFFAASAEAVTRCLDFGGTIWLYAGSVQTMEYVLARELVRMSESEAESLSPLRAIVKSRRLLKAFSADKQWLAKKAGSLANIGCTSFFPAKPLGCYGDGGAVFTDDDVIADSLRSIRVHGKGTHKYDNARIGLNARLDTIQAAVLNAKFDIFPQEIELRNQVALKYTELLSPLSFELSALSSYSSQLSAPQVPPGLRSAWAQYSLLSDKKDQIQSALKEKGIPTAVYYPKPLHLQTAFAYLEYKEGDMPASEDCSKRIFSLPMHPYLKDREIERICKYLSQSSQSPQR